MVSIFFCRIVPWGRWRGLAAQSGNGVGKDLALHRPDGEAVAPIAVVLRVDSTTAEVQVSSAASRVERGRPVEAIATAEVPRRPTAVAGR